MRRKAEKRNSSPAVKSNAGEGNTIELATMLFEHIEDQIDRADTKARLTLAADTLLAAAVTVSGKGTLSQLLCPTAPAGDRLAGSVTVLLFTSLIASIYFALSAVTPILRLQKQRQSLFYFGDIAQMSEREFINGFAAQSEAEMRESILAQVYAKAVIASHKFVAIHRSAESLIIALFLWAVLQAILSW